MTCPVCGDDRAKTVATYKHDWSACARCGSATRHRKPRYPLGRIVPRRFLRSAPAGLLNMLYPVEAVVADGKRFYDYYDEASAAGVEGTKWVAQLERVTGRLRERGIGWESVDVLDVSGGPGFITHHFATHGARRAMVTEFSEPSVEGMRRHLSIEAAKFDYQADRLDEVAPGPWDLVLVDASINFTLELERFAGEIARVTRPGGHLYVSWSTPTLGCMMRWQFDDYTYLVLMPDAVVAGALERAGFTEVASYVDARYDYRDALPLRRRLVLDPIALWYRARAPRHGVDRTLDQVVTARIFRRN